jgi:hypothetical protein
MCLLHNGWSEVLSSSCLPAVAQSFPRRRVITPPESAATSLGIEPTDCPTPTRQTGNRCQYVSPACRSSVLKVLAQFSGWRAWQDSTPRPAAQQAHFGGGQLVRRARYDLPAPRNHRSCQVTMPRSLPARHTGSAGDPSASFRCGCGGLERSQRAMSFATLLGLSSVNPLSTLEERAS